MTSKPEWTNGGAPAGGTRTFAIICTGIAVPLLLTALLLTEDRLAAVKTLVATLARVVLPFLVIALAAAYLARVELGLPRVAPSTVQHP
jgi:hypothetical protein